MFLRILTLVYGNQKDQQMSLCFGKLNTKVISLKKVNDSRIICIFEAGFIFEKDFKIMFVKKSAQNI